jgi:nicotinate-nucleotide adenylyltransferase
MHAPDAEDTLRLCYGGTFDPIHDGHLAIACAARDAFDTPVWLIPAADPPHRAAPGARAAQRADMIALAIADIPGLRLDLREIERACTLGRPSYTYDTLLELRQALGPTRPLAWLVGADSFIGLPSWHRWRELGELAHLVIAERPGSTLDAELPDALADWARDRWAGTADALKQHPAGRLWRLHQPLRAESASQVRAEIAGGGDWRALVPAPVAGYIATHGLYASRPA